MAAHVRRVESLLSPTGLWDTGFQFGDWLDPTAPPDEPADAKADKGVVATACLYRSARLTADAARLLGRAADADRFRALAERTRAAFTEHYVTDDGTVHSDAQTVYALAIVFGLLDEPVRAAGRGPARRARRRERLPHLHRFRRHPVRHRRAHSDRPPRRRLPAAAPARVPVVALLGDHGRHHRLGALGLDAARREHQPRPDDELQPLRPRRRRGLDAPRHRRDRARGARLPHASASPPGPAADSPGPGPPSTPGTGRSPSSGGWTTTCSRSTSPSPTG